jgi:hypothetical protein
MAKSRAEMMEIMEKLLAESAEFQDRRPDVPQGDLRAPTEEELDILVTEFRRDGAIEANDTDRRHGDLCSIERRLGHPPHQETWT